jgi:hypothetical protein
MQGREVFNDVSTEMKYLTKIIVIDCCCERVVLLSFGCPKWNDGVLARYIIRSWLFNYGMDNSCRSVLPFGIKAATKKKEKKKKTANQFFYRNISMT